MFPNSFGLCLLSSFCFGGNKINILDTNVRHILRRCTLPARPLAFPQRLSPLSVKAATSPPPAAAPSRSRSPTSRGHPPRAACAPPAPAAHLPPTCRAGVHARRDPAPPGNLPVRLPALLRTPHPLPPRSPAPAAYLPPTCRAGVHARRNPAQPGNFPVRPPALLRTPHPLPPRPPGPGRSPPAHL